MISGDEVQKYSIKSAGSCLKSNKNKKKQYGKRKAIDVNTSANQEDRRTCSYSSNTIFSQDAGKSIILDQAPKTNTGMNISMHEFYDGNRIVHTFYQYVDNSYFKKHFHI